ncbi:TRIC cation channel family protein [Burkholderiaceae bacterium DAT-1]|nr:TRIC cation channel family protein [Burkholderiaceae bacterium DAT-1]
MIELNEWASLAGKWLFDMDWLYLVGTAAFSLSGYLLGVKKKFDLLGIVIVSLLTAIGGGIIRDVMLNRIPVIFHHAEPLYIIFTTLALAWLLRMHKGYGAAAYRIFIVADSIGLVAFSLAGAEVGMQYELNLFGVLLVGFVSAVGGGIVRDMMVNDVPFILHKDFYGTVSILAAASLYIAHMAFHLNGPTLVWGLFAVCLAARLIGHRQDFRLPKV